MKRQGILAAMMAVLLAASVSGCGGGGAEMKSDIRTTTRGQELLDLKKALDTGAITQEQFDAQRKKILEGQ